MNFRAGRFVQALLLATAVSLLTGCSLSTLRSKFNAHLADEKAGIGVAKERLAELDQATYSFADRYVTLLSDSCDAVARDNPNREARKQALRLKLHNASSAYAIVTGPNPLGQLLDLATVVTLNKIDLVDEKRARMLFGAHAEVIETAFNKAYEDIWSVAGRFLKESEVLTVTRLIGDWRRRHPKVKMLAYVRFDDFARAQAGLTQENPEIGGLFDRISEVNQTVLTAQQFGERALYYVQRAPRLWQWQTERTVEGVLENMDLQRFQESIIQVSQAANTFAAEIKQFEKHQALLQRNLEQVSGIVGQIDTLAPRIESIVRESDKLMTTTGSTVLSLGETVKAVDTVSTHFKSNDDPNAAPGKPFDVNEYTQLVSEASRTVDSAHKLLAALDDPRLARQTQALQLQLRQEIDHLAWRVVQIVLLLFLLAAVWRFMPRVGR